MIASITAILFDWGWALYDSHDRKELSGSEEALTFCKSKGYRLALVSLVTKRYTPDTSKSEREQQIESSLLRKYFEFVLVTDDETGKDKALDEAVERLGILRANILIVDDRTVRGIRYANLKGHPSVWLQRGKFADELPDESIGRPTQTIHSLGELKDIL